MFTFVWLQKVFLQVFSIVRIVFHRFQVGIVSYL